MRLIDFCLIVISVAVCVPSAITDIRYERIRNILILPALSVAFILNLINSIIVGNWDIFLANFCFMTLFGLILYGTHYMGAGDSKLLSCVAAAMPVCFYENRIHGWFGEVLVLIHIFVVCMIYILGESIYIRAVLKNKGSPIGNFNIRRFLIAYFKGLIIITLINQLFWLLSYDFYIENQYAVMLLNCIIAIKLPEIKIFDHLYVMIPLIVIEVIILLATDYGQRFIGSDYRILIFFLIFLIVRRLLVDRYNYKTVPTSEVKAGMILSIQSTILMSKSKVKGLPGVSTEDMRSRLTEEEAESIHRWEKSKYGAKEVSVVRHLPFGFFISAGTIIFIAESVVGIICG